MPEDAGTGDDGEEWRFSVEEVGDDAGDAVETEAETETVDSDESWAVTVGDDDSDGPAVAFDGQEHAAEEGSDALDGGDGGNVAGTVTPEVPVESDTPELESAVFVAAGALLVLLVFASIVTPLTLQTISAVGAAVVVVTAVLYAVFVQF